MEQRNEAKREAAVGPLLIGVALMSFLIGLAI